MTVAAQADGTVNISRAHLIGFTVLCLLWASAWLLDNAYPSGLPSAERQGFHLLLLAAVFAVVVWKRARRTHHAPRSWMALALASIALLALPAFLTGITLSDLSQVTVATSYALLPVMVVVLTSLIGPSPASNASLAVALTGLAGAMLVLPFETPASGRQWSMESLILLAVLLTAAASVALYRLLPAFSVLEATAVYSLANGIAFFAAYALHNQVSRPNIRWTWPMATSEAAVALFFDLPQTLLLLWLLRDIPPRNLSARYFMVPLLTVLEGYAMFRPEVTARLLVGLLLMAFGAWRLMISSSGEEPSLMLR